MAITKDTGTSETTITQETLSLKSDLVALQEALETFLQQPTCEQTKPSPPYADPIAEEIAKLQDCRKLVLHIKHLAMEKIAKRIIA